MADNMDKEKREGGLRSRRPSDLIHESQSIKGHKSSSKSRLSSHHRNHKSGSSSSKIDAKAKLERSRQSARECRARKKLRYQYLEDLVTKREKSVILLQKEIQSNLELLKQVEAGKKSFDCLKNILSEKS